MSKTSVIESLLKERESKRRQANRTAWDRYRSMLRALHDGSAVTPDEAGGILSAVDKSIEDLARDIETFGQRVMWAEKVAAKAEAEAECEAVHKEIAHHEKEIADLRAKLIEKIEHAHNRLATLTGFLCQADAARTRLSETVLDGLLVEDAERLENELKPLRLRFAALNNAQLDGKGEEGNEPERLALLRTIAKLEAQVDELRQRKLEP